MTKRYSLAKSVYDGFGRTQRACVSVSACVSSFLKPSINLPEGLALDTSKPKESRKKDRKFKIKKSNKKKKKIYEIFRKNK